jgi:hypothetical protein
MTAVGEMETRMRAISFTNSRTRFGTGYCIYQQFVRGIPLSQPIKAWDGKTPPEQDVMDLIGFLRMDSILQFA